MALIMPVLLLFLAGILDFGTDLQQPPGAAPGSRVRSP